MLKYFHTDVSPEVFDRQMQQRNKPPAVDRALRRAWCQRWRSKQEANDGDIRAVIVTGQACAPYRSTSKPDDGPASIGNSVDWIRQVSNWLGHRSRGL